MSLEIDRLVLDLPGMDPEEGRRLAERLAHHLGVALEEPLTRGASTPIERLDVTAQGDPHPETLSRAIAAALRQRIG